MDRVLIAGAGVFGVTAAIELRKRGHPVMLVDPGPLPHPLAASTDISKVVRLEYGADEPYTALAERAIEGWRRWNRDLGPLYRETGRPGCGNHLQPGRGDRGRSSGSRSRLLDAARAPLAGSGISLDRTSRLPSRSKGARCLQAGAFSGLLRGDPEHRLL